MTGAYDPASAMTNANRINERHSLLAASQGWRHSGSHENRPPEENTRPRVSATLRVLFDALLAQAVLRSMQGLTTLELDCL